MNVSISRHRFRLGAAVVALMLLLGLSVSAAYASGGSPGTAGRMTDRVGECSIAGVPVEAGTSDSCGEWLWTGGDAGALTAGAYAVSFQDVSGYAARVTGRVTEKATGDSVEGLSVNLLLPDGSQWSSPALTDASGYYDIGGLPADSYRVVFGDQSGYYARQYYNRKPTLALAGRVTVGEGDTAAGIDAALVEAESDAPHTTATPARGWMKSGARVTLRASDDRGGSGVFATYYRINGGATKTYTGPFTVSTPGAVSLEYWSIDWAGNVEAKHRVAFTIVRTPSSHGTPSTPSAPSHVRHGQRFTTFGFIVKHRSGTSPATLQFYRYKSGRWVYSKSTSARVSTVLTFSRYSDSTSVPYAGKWRVRARHKVGSHYRYSGYRSFTAS